MDTFGKRLKKLREQKELSQKTLADIFNISQSTIAYYEIDKKQPSQITLAKFADFFSVTTDYLLCRTDNHHDINDEPTPQELEKVLRESNIAFDGAPLDEDDKEDVIEFIKIALRSVKKRKR